MNNYSKRLSKITRILFLFVIINLSEPFNKTFADKVELIPKSYLILPEKTNLKIKWISMPLEQKFDYKSNNIQFIANSDKLLILYDGRIVQNLISGGLIKLNKTVKGFHFLKSGALIFFDEGNLLYGELNTNAKVKIPEVNLKPVATLALKNLSFFKGGGDELYASGYNESNNNFEIYQLDLNKKNFKKVAVSKEKIDCITGIDNRIYVSSGKKIKELVKDDFILYYEHPREEILEIYYKENLGIFYRTKHGVGYIKDGYGLEFLQLEEPLVYFDDNKMYVLMPKNLGIFFVENIDDLKNYNYRVNKLIGIERNF